jgi:cytochrome b pre-mRNA-processing protein 3
MLTQLIRFFKPSRQQHCALMLYQKLVTQARQPLLYSELEVPDTLDGRFEMILLHMFMTMQRIREGISDDRKDMERLLAEAMFSDMDRSLREIGVTDSGVGRRIRAMAEAFYGRLKAYELALNDADTAKLAEALRRNAYGTAQYATDASVHKLAAYVRMNTDVLKTQSVADIVSGNVTFQDFTTELQ